MRIWQAGIAVLVAVLALRIWSPAPLERLNSTAYDILLRSTPTKAASGDVAIVMIDEPSLRQLGRWPWPRARLAQLVDAIHDSGAAVVALDVLFPEPDSVENDARLAQSLRRGKTLVGYHLSFDKSRPNPECAMHPVGVSFKGNGPRFLKASGVVCSVSMLSRATSGSGFLNIYRDPDGQVRRSHLFLSLGDTAYPSLPLAALIAATGKPQTLLFNGAESFRFRDRTIAIDEDGTMWVRFRGPAGTIPRIGAVEALSNPSKAAQMLRGKVVFVGGTALGMSDVVGTPLDSLMPGLELTANVADNIIQADPIRRPLTLLPVELILAFVLWSLPMLLLTRERWVATTAVAVVGCAVVWGLASWSLAARNLFLSPVAPILNCAGVMAVAGPMALSRARRAAEARARQAEKARRFALVAAARLAEAHDPGSGRHPTRVGNYVRLLAESVRRNPRFVAVLTPDVIELLQELAPIHDIGKAGIPDEILAKKGALTTEEAAVVRQHVTYGRQVLRDAWQSVGGGDDVMMQMATDMVYAHHEWWDGTGYPEGLNGDRIPLAARLVSLADVYDSLMTKRPFKESMSHEMAVQVILMGRGTRFDPDLVNGFMRTQEKWRSAAAKFRESEGRDATA
jgi:adenylate cyclase